jgi:hypothetical protein
VALLEQIDTEEARRLLAVVAGGYAEASPTRAARAALERLTRQTPPDAAQLAKDLHGQDIGAAARAFLITARAVPALPVPGPAESEELLHLVGQVPPANVLTPPGNTAPARTDVPPRLLRTIRILYRASENEPPFQKALRDAAAALRAGERDLRLETELAVPPRARMTAFATRLETIQRDQIAAAMAPLMIALDDLEALGMQRTQLLPYWQATDIYLRARIHVRLAQLHEYSWMLAQARKENMPLLDLQVHRGWRMRARSPFGDRDADRQAKQARKLADSLIQRHPGSSWAYAATQLTLPLTGLEWEPHEK